MDSEKFDDLIKRMGTARVTRLTALRGLVGGAVAAVAGTAIATSDADAKSKKRGKSKKKGKKKSRRSQALAPVYNDSPSKPSKPGDKTPTDGTTSGPVCDTYEDCGYDAKWDDEECRCVCKNDYKEFCNSEYADDYLYGTCISSRCEEYTEYSPRSCSCEEVCYPQTCKDLYAECGVHDDGCGGKTEDCGQCNAYDNSVCDYAGRCVCDAYTEKDCPYLIDAYADECQYDPYGSVEVRDGCGSKIICPCKILVAE